MYDLENILLIYMFRIMKDISLFPMFSKLQICNFLFETFPKLLILNFTRKFRSPQLESSMSTRGLSEPVSAAITGSKLG